MKNFKIFFIFFVFSFLFISCSGTKNLTENQELIPLSQSLIERYNIKKKELSKAQFWSGDSIVLVRKIITKKTSNTSDGKLVLRNDTTFEYVVIPPFTPGVFVSPWNGPNKNIINISFSSEPKEFLSFGQGEGEEKNYTLIGDSKGVLLYGNYNFFLLSGGESLLINPSFLEGKDKIRYMPGRKVGQKK